jgi:prepilin-type N-terminal cleavage/methylation domain-containing protein
MREFRDSRLGFSLIEAVAVLAIAAIMATLSIAYLARARPHAQLERAEVEISSQLARARNLAISDEIPVKVMFDGETGAYHTEAYDREGESWNQVGPAYGLPTGVAFTEGGITFADSEVRFTPRGTLMAGGSITVACEGETGTLTGNVATGRFPLAGGHLR